MAIDSGQIDLNADAVLSDREDETFGSKLPEHVVNAEIYGTETLTEHINGKFQAQHHMVCQAGDDEVANAPEELLCGSHLGGKEGYDQGTKFVDTSNASGAGTELFNVGCDVKASDFLRGLVMVKNEDKELITECSNGTRVAYGGTETDEGLITEFSDGIANVTEVTKYAPLSIELELNKIATHKNMPECGKEDEFANGASSSEEVMQKRLNEKTNKEASSMNLRGLVEHGSEIKAANDILSKNGLQDCNATELTESTCKFQDLIPDMEVKDVSAKESLPHKDPILWNHLYELESSHGSKQPAFDVHAQAGAIQSQTTDTIVEEAGPFNNIQNEFHGINVFVDRNSYRNSKSVDAKRKSASSPLNLHVSDLVWGKVRGHPWWPGQIFDRSAASENAKKHLKIDSYLIAYFGDQTFAWNESFKIKPFQTHFSQMEKQSNLENFHHAVDCALDEVSRRVEFGLSCPCIPEEVFEKIKTQVIYNAGIQNQSSRIEGGDRFLNAISFEPKKLFNIVKSLAKLPFIEFDRMEFVIARAQLLAFYRAKGYPHLPEFRVLDGLIENDMDIISMGEIEQYDDQTDSQGDPKAHLGFPHKRKYISIDSTQPKKKHKCLSDLILEDRFCIPNGENISKRKGAGPKSISSSSAKKHKAIQNASRDYTHKSQSRKLFQLQCISVDEMLSKLHLAARDPFRETHKSVMLNFFSEFRKFITPNDSASLEQGISLEQMHAEETGVSSMEAVVPVTSAMEPSHDLY